MAARVDRVAYCPNSIDYVEGLPGGLHGGHLSGRALRRPGEEPPGRRQSCRRLAQANLRIGEQPGLIAELVGSHEQVKNEIVKALDELKSVCEASAAELDRAWQMYDHVDSGSADRLDRTYPDPGAPPRMPSVPGLPADTNAQVVRQVAFPAERLTPPRAEEFTNPIQIVNDLGNLISRVTGRSSSWTPPSTSIRSKSSLTGWPETGSSSPRRRMP
ncbi:hypothetical protein OG439_32835 [Amycolatopsis sp. NBC_01307]|uniref:hypothetical protein n=1 Tax=Amycolatopsis sp. NBC_01307 TaxID=2903561 RepID=UPI002E0D89EB|nr:hypothetical protein OG439_32835 [Amycolatopsis sp. NBC_01307]